MDRSRLSYSTSSLSTPTAPSHLRGSSIPNLGSSSSSLRGGPSSLKRGASDAGLEGSSSIRKSMQPPVSAAVIQQKYLEACKARDQATLENEELRSEVTRLRGERLRFHDGEIEERTTGEMREKEFAEERLRMSKTIRELRIEKGAVETEMAGLRSHCSQIEGQHAALSINSNNEIALLNGRIKEIEDEREALRGWERRARGLSIDLEELKRMYESGRNERDEVRADKRADDTLRKELRRQSTQFSFTQAKVSQLETEVHELRAKKKDIDAAERAWKDVERALKEDNQKLQEQLERYRRDMDSLTQSFGDQSGSSSTSPKEDLATLQSRCSTLATLHAEVNNELANTKSTLRETHDRLSALSESSTSAIRDLNEKLREAERNLRWANEGRHSAERKEQLLREELRVAKDSGNATSSSPAVTGDAAKKIRDLEELVDTYRTEIEAAAADSRAVEERLTQGAGLVKQSLLDDATERISQLEKDIQALETTISQLTTANTTLDAEVNDLMRRVASGEYNPATQRCIELKLNPASKELARRTKVLEDLKAENVALLKRLGEVDRSSSSGGTGQAGGGEQGGQLVPRESFDRLNKEKEDMEVAHQKRLARLKDVFGVKSREFLEAVYSLLGWRIKFDESGRDIRLTSMYAPKGKMGLTLKFASQEGHFGTMQMIGQMGKGLEESRRFWIDERQSVPGFLAQVTTEMFEKTTIGRAAGYVGLE